MEEGSILIFGILISYTVFVNCFNIMEKNKIIRLSLNTTMPTQFGYSLAFSSTSKGYQLLVGAPKEYSSQGAIYSCRLGDEKSPTCNELMFSGSYQKASQRSFLDIDFERTRLLQLNGTDDFDWSFTQRETPSANTGPRYDHTFLKEKNGTYMFIESSIPRAVGQTAVLSTKSFPSTSGSCLRFWYHMYGSTVGSLNVYIFSDPNYRMIWTASGNKNNSWLEGWKTIVSENSYKILFEGVVGSGPYSDIGLDDIKAHYGACVEDNQPDTGSLGMTLKRDSTFGNILACAPTWTYVCDNLHHMTGLCYQIKEDTAPKNLVLLSPCTNPDCNDGKMDLIFLIDGSDSISISDFNNMILWLSNVVSSLPIYKDLTRVGIAQFSSYPRTEFPLNRYHNLKDLRKAIKNITHIRGNTATGKALDYMNNEMFHEDHGMRADAKHVAVVITDGKSQDDVIPASLRVKNRGITIFAIGVGNLDESELNDISSNPDDKFTYFVNSFKALDGIRDQLQKKLFTLESQGSTFTTEQCQSGMSATFINSQPVLGLPGLQDWRGGISMYSENTTTQHKISLLNLLAEKRNKSMNRQQSNITNTKTKFQNIGFSYFGYSMAAGSHYQVGSQELVVGSPRFQSIGAIFILNATNDGVLLDQHNGDQIGEYFGYSICVTDMNNDGLSEIIVGSPLFVGEHGNEGRVTIFSHGLEIKTKHALSGRNGRFGFSIAATGDMNGDEYGDIIIGAPSDLNGDGAVYLYNGRKDLTMLTKPSQIIKSSAMKTKPVFFGFSLESELDIDRNMYPDITIGAPGSDEVFVMFARPVIHVKASIHSIPQTVNVSKSSCYVSEEFALSYHPKACSDLELCFMVHGRNIPQILMLNYDLLINDEYERAKFVNPRNEIIPTPGKKTCIHETLAFKESMYNFSDVAVGVQYKLSSKLNYTDHSPVLNIYDTNPVYTVIRLTRWCKNVNCESNLEIQSSIQSKEPDRQGLRIGKDKIITLKVNLRNTEDIAVMAKVHVHYHHGLYFSHIQQDKSCIAIDGVQNFQESENGTGQHCASYNCSTGTIKMNRVFLKYQSPILEANELCEFQMKFGIADESSFYGNNLTIVLHASTTSKDLDEADNYSNISVPIHFVANTELNGYTDYSEITLPIREELNESLSLLDQVGPNMKVSFFVTNTGYWKIPHSIFKITWPNATQNHKEILYPVGMQCQPENKCLCADYEPLLNRLNLSDVSEPDLNYTELANLTSGMAFSKEALLDCKQGGLQCITISCSIFNLNPLDMIELKVNFRIWERTISQIEAWKTKIIIKSQFSSSHQSKNVILQPFELMKTVKVSVLSPYGKQENDGKIRIWVVVLAASIGIILLCLLILLLYKAKFFESKYRNMKEEILEWHDYKYPNAHEGRVQIQVRSDEGKETIIHKLSTFQR